MNKEDCKHKRKYGKELLNGHYIKRICMDCGKDIDVIRNITSGGSFA